jgi:predicted metalloendopeptidase
LQERQHAETTPPSLGAGIDVTGMDKSVAPGDDFNTYANGGWIKATQPFHGVRLPW